MNVSNYEFETFNTFVIQFKIKTTRVNARAQKSRQKASNKQFFIGAVTKYRFATKFSNFVIESSKIFEVISQY